MWQNEFFEKEYNDNYNISKIKLIKMDKEVKRTKSGKTPGTDNISINIFQKSRSK